MRGIEILSARQYCRFVRVCFDSSIPTEVREILEMGLLTSSEAARVTPSVLVVGRSQTLADALSYAFEQTGHPALAASREDVLAVIAEAEVATVVVDADGDSESVVQLVNKLRRQLGDVDVILLVSERGPSLVELVAQTRAQGSITRDLDPSRFVKAVIAGGTSPDGLSVRRATALDNSVTPLAGLTERQREVLTELLTGGSDAQMAVRLGLSAYTVRTHIQNVFSKLGVKTRFEAAAIALQAGLRPPEDSKL